MTHVFRLYPEPGTLFVRVRVWPTLAEVRRHVNGLKRCGQTWGPSMKRALGVCTPWTVWEVRPGHPLRRDPCVAEVNLARGWLGTAIVTHEMYHATTEWGRRIGLDFSRLDAADSVNQDEERLADIHGELCRQFVDRAHAAGLYE
jgi:hypothetical protein